MKIINKCLKSLSVLKITFLFLIIPVLFSSCSSNKNDNKKELSYTKIIQDKDAHSLIDELYLGSDNDIESLSKILNIEPTTLSRLKERKTIPSQSLDKRIREVSLCYNINNQSYTKLKKEYKVNFIPFVDDILYSPILSPWLFYGITGFIVIVLILITVLYFMHFDTDECLAVVGLIFLGEIFLFVIMGIISYIFG